MTAPPFVDHGQTAATADVDGDGEITVLARGLTVRGDVFVGDDLHVHGRIEGRLQADGAVFVHPAGAVFAHIAARRVFIAGVVVGDVQAAEWIEIAAGGAVHGDLRAERVVVADGAALRGSVSLLPQAAPAPTARRAGDDDRDGDRDDDRNDDHREGDRHAPTPVPSFDPDRTAALDDDDDDGGDDGDDGDDGVDATARGSRRSRLPAAADGGPPPARGLAPRRRRPPVRFRRASPAPTAQET